jgi:hypothetical protein
MASHTLRMLFRENVSHDKIPTPTRVESKRNGPQLVNRCLFPTGALINHATEKIIRIVCKYGTNLIICGMMNFVHCAITKNTK